MRAVIAITACLAVASACRSSLPCPSEAELRSAAKSVVHEPTFTLYSPYDAAATAAYADAIRSECALVSRLFGDDGTRPVSIALAPIDDDSGRDVQFWQTPSHRSLKGAATRREFAFVYVPARIDPASALARSLSMYGGTLRHELTHLYAARAGLARAPWFDEGLAQEVECMRTSGPDLEVNPIPPLLLLARETVRPGSLAGLLAWTQADDLTPEQRSLRYVGAHALLRYLLEQRPEDRFDARVRAVMNLDQDAILAQERAWLAWLAELDVLARIRAGAHSASSSVRALSIGVMPTLAERGAKELFTRAADELALEMLVDPACTEPAATFLVFFRARELRADDLERLSRSTDPAAILTAQALHARRKEPVDLEQARDALQRVPKDDRPRFNLLETFLFGSSRAPAPSRADGG